MMKSIRSYIRGKLAELVMSLVGPYLDKIMAPYLGQLAELSAQVDSLASQSSELWSKLERLAKVADKLSERVHDLDDYVYDLKRDVEDNTYLDDSCVTDIVQEWLREVLL